MLALSHLFVGSAGVPPLCDHPWPATLGRPSRARRLPSLLHPVPFLLHPPPSLLDLFLPLPAGWGGGTASLSPFERLSFLFPISPPSSESGDVRR